ncbi:L-arabinose transport system permease protein AraP [Lachnospiraceae bacterium]|nr:L-arabinose transport system permease protein AraP [Lachnospiraceae bacterium]
MKKIRKMFRYENVGMLFVLPAFLYMLVFVGYPIIRNIILSFQDVGAGNLVRGTKNFIMFDNYLELFKDSVFRTSLFNTLRYTILCLVFQFIIGFILALFYIQHIFSSCQLLSFHCTACHAAYNILLHKNEYQCHRNNGYNSKSSQITPFRSILPHKVKYPSGNRTLFLI